jgi:hypothetical protein
VRPEYAGRAGGTIAGVKKVLAVVFAVAAVVVAIVWWRGRGGEPPRPAPSATVGSAGATLAGPGAPAPAAPLTGRVEGTVVGADGQPVPGATVAVVDRGPPRAVEPDGRFVVPDLEAGTYAVVAAAPGHLPARADAVEVAAGAAARVALTLTVGGHSVTGVVSDASGGPIEGATVTAARREALGAGDMIAATLTDRDGRYRLTLAPGSYVVSGEREDYVRATADLEVADLDRTLDLRLVPAGVVEGVVKDVASGAPVAGAKVEASAARPGRFGGGRRSRPVTTDAGGRFRLTGLTPGAIALSARVDADGRQSPEPTEVLLGIGEQVTGVELWVEAAPYLAGRVVDADGRPIADANVMAMGGTSGESTQTDPDGRFRVLGLDPGAYQVFASHPRYASAPPRRIELADRSVTDLELRLTASPRVVGRVEPPTEAAITVDPDRDPAGFEPTMWTAIDQRSRPDGSFEVTPITAGAHTIAAKATDGRRGQATVVVPAQGDATVVIRLEDGGSIAGTVRDQQGQAVVGAAVIIRKTSGAVLRRMIVNGVETSADRAITDRAGAYLMRGLEAGRYELAVLDERGGALTLRGRAAPTVRLADREAKRGVDLTVEVDDGVIRGVVTGADGAPKADAWVTAVMRLDALVPAPRAGDDDGPGETSTTSVMVVTGDTEGGPFGATAPVLTDDQGRFELRGLRRGRYDVVAEADRGALRARTVDVATGTTIAIRLTGLGALTGVVTTPTGPAADYTVELDGPTTHRQRVRAADGRFRIDRLEPGTYQIAVNGPSGSGQATATVAVGSPAEVAIAVVANGRVTGRLLTADGAPVANVSVLAMPGKLDGHGSFTMDGPPETTDAAGRFSLIAAPGVYSLLALRPDASPRTDIAFTIVAGQTVELGDVHLPATPPPPPEPSPPSPPSP